MSAKSSRAEAALKSLQPLHLHQVTIHRPVIGSSLRCLKTLASRAAVIAVDREDLNDLFSSKLLDNRAAAYVLTGPVDGVLHVRIGEGVKLGTRLQEHRRDPSLGFFNEIFVIVDVGGAFDKNHGILLQERLTHLAREAGTAIYSGTGPLSLFPADEGERSALEIVIAGTVPLLRDAGCRAFGKGGIQ